MPSSSVSLVTSLLDVTAFDNSQTLLLMVVMAAALAEREAKWPAE